VEAMYQKNPIVVASGLHFLNIAQSPIENCALLSCNDHVERWFQGKQ
jgi:hypothetical protein